MLIPGVVDGWKEVMEEMVAKGGENEQQVSLVQISYCVQLPVAKMRNTITVIADFTATFSYLWTV